MREAPGNPAGLAFMLPKRTSFGDFSPGSGRRQCEAIARTTDERCRRDAMQGSGFCRLHGGARFLEKRVKELHPAAELALRPGVDARRALAAIAFDPETAREVENIPIFVKNKLALCSPSERARAVEAWRNRELDPETWKKTVETLKTRRKRYEK